LQEALAARVPPLKEIVWSAVVDNVPPHCVEDPVLTVRPLGRVSEKPIPVNATPEFGFVIVNVSVDVAPTATGFGENTLVIVGGLGTTQPVKVTSSKYKSEPGLLLPASKPYIRKLVNPDEFNPELKVSVPKPLEGNQVFAEERNPDML
jgi:hypothetical protein